MLDNLYSLKLRFTDPQDQFKIDGWIKDAQKFLLIDSLKEHKGIFMILENFKTEIIQMNDILLGMNSKSLPDFERDRIINRRDLYQSFLKFFDEAQSGIDYIDKEIEQYK